MRKKWFEYQVKNRYLIYFVLIGYVMGCFLGLFVHNVEAVSSSLGTSIGTSRFASYGSENILRLNNGSLLAFYGNNSASYKIQVWQSNNNGSTWIKKYSGTPVGAGYIFSVAMRSNQNISLFTAGKCYFYNYVLATFSAGITFDGSSSSTDAACFVDSSNNIHIVYVGATSLLYTQYVNLTSSFAGSYTVSAVSTASYPDIVLASDGKAYITWCEKAGSDYQVFYRTRTSGGVWSSKIQITSDSGFKTISHIDIDDDTIYLSYAHNTSSSVYVFKYRFFISAWSSEYTIVTDTLSLIYNNILLDKSGNVYFIYEKHIGPTYGIYQRCLSDNYLYPEEVLTETTNALQQMTGLDSTNGNNKCRIGDGFAFIFKNDTSLKTCFYSSVSDWDNGTLDGGGCYNVSGFDQENSLRYDDLSPYTLATTSSYLETKYAVPVDGMVYGVGLYVNSMQLLVSTDLLDYDLQINGYPQGNPSCFVPFGDEEGYIIFWDLSYDTGNNPLLFEFYSAGSYGGTRWSVYKDASASTSDNWFYGKYHSSLSLYNGLFDGTILSGYGEFQMSFWYDAFLFENETSPYDDLVTSTKNVFETYELVPVYYTIADFSYSNTLELWHAGLQLDTQGFPYDILTGNFNGELSFVPFHNGSYQFRIVRNSVVESSFNFTVVDPDDDDFVLVAYPNPANFNSLVSIGFRFFPSDGSDGFIGLSRSSTINNYSSFEEKWVIEANTSGNKTCYASDEWYVSLYKETGSTFVRMKIIKIKIFSVFDNTVNVLYKDISLSVDVPSVTQRIYGTQVIRNFPTFIRMNNKIIGYVTDSEFYNVYVDVVKAGKYKVDLCMNTANGTVVLCSVNFSVSSFTSSSGGAEVFPAEMKLLFGICCILVAVSCPLMISVKYHVAVPTFVYVVFMAFGIGIGTVLGFLELWLVFLFVVALVAGAVFTIFGHGSSGGGGGGGDSGTIRKGGILSRRGGKDYAGASRKADYGVSPKGSPGYLKGPGRRGY